MHALARDHAADERALLHSAIHTVVSSRSAASEKVEQGAVGAGDDRWCTADPLMWMRDAVEGVLKSRARVKRVRRVGPVRRDVCTGANRRRLACIRWAGRRDC
eukprot:2795549-Pleurochrysis_carterae.AAC.1